MRTLRRSITRYPGSSAAAIVMVASGVGLLTLALALADAARWRPLPFPGADDVVALFSQHSSPREVRTRVRWSYPRIQYVREHASTVDLVTSWSATSLTLTGRDDPQTVSGEFVSRAFFPLLGVQPIEGRTFAPDEDQAGAPLPVAVVSESFRNRRRDAGDSVGPGRTIRLNGTLVTVIGVLPESFRGLSGQSELWLPPPMAPRLTYPEYLTTDQDFIMLIARPRAGQTAANVERETAMLAEAANRFQPSDDFAPGITISGRTESLGEVRLRPEVARGATLALAGSALLFLLACANVAALLLARTVTRRRESAVTLALGATPARIWRAFAAEGMSIVLIGALLGIVGLVLWIRASAPFDPLATLGRGAFGTFTALQVTPRLFGWWFAVTAMTCGLVAALPSCWAARRVQLDHLRDGAHASGATGFSYRRPGVAAALLVVEATLAVVLVSTAAQLLESYRRMQGVNVGVDPEHVLTFEVHPAESNIPPAVAPAFVERVLESIRSVPGVMAASVDGGAPLAGSANSRLHVVGQPDDPSGGAPLVLRHYVGPGHFAALGIPLRAGRAFTAADREDAPRVVIASETAARQYFPDGNAIGQRVWFGGSTLTSPDSSGEIVGVVGDVKYDPLIGERTTASFYTPYMQFTYGWRVYFVRVSGEPMVMQRSISDSVHRVAPDLPLLNVRPLTAILDGSNANSRRLAWGFGLVAALGLLVAVSGIWAIVAHATAQRERDMAIRVAHGATAGAVVRLVTREGLAYPVIGLGLGAIAAVAAGRLLRASLYEVEPGDPVIIVVGGMLFLAVATIACLFPAWRASRVDPIPALRSD